MPGEGTAPQAHHWQASTQGGLVPSNGSGGLPVCREFGPQGLHPTSEGRPCLRLSAAWQGSTLTWRCNSATRPWAWGSAISALVLEKTRVALREGNFPVVHCISVWTSSIFSCSPSPLLLCRIIRINQLTAINSRSVAIVTKHHSHFNS